MLTIELPYPPSINTYWRRVGGRTLISRRGREFRQTVCYLLAQQGVRCHRGPLTVGVQLHPPDRRRRDIDNCVKALLDALQHGRLFEDDYQIQRLVIERDVVIRGGSCVVTLEEQ